MCDFLCTDLNDFSAFLFHFKNVRVAWEQECDKNYHDPLKLDGIFNPGYSFDLYGILECFANIQIGLQKMYNKETVTKVAGFVNRFENSTFLFWKNV